MDLQTTATTLTISTKHMDEYKRLYSEYISRAVEVHNYHRVFIVHTGYDTGLAVRKNLRAMRELERHMLRECKLAYWETKNNKKILAKQAKLEEIAYRKANPKKRGPKKRTEQ